MSMETVKSQKQRLSTREMVLIALMAAVTAVLSQLAIPMPSGMPLTMQTLAVALCGYVLGARRGAAAVGLFLLLGGVGLPVFSNFRGGVGILFGPTGGFLWGFLALAWCCGRGRGQKTGPALLWSLPGLLACHALGALWYGLLGHISWLAAFLLVSAPYLLKDAASLIAAYYLARALSRRL